MQQRPVGQQVARVGVQPVLAAGDQRLQGCAISSQRLRGLNSIQHVGSRLQLLDFAGQLGLRFGPAGITAQGIGNFGQVAGTSSGHYRRLVRTVAHGHQWQWGSRGTVRQRHAQCVKAHFKRLVKRCHSVVIKTRCHGAKHRHVFLRLAPGFAVALHLLADIAQGIVCAFAVKLVDCHKLGKVQHVDFLQLGGGAKFGCHDIQRHIHQRHDGGIALADARGFDNHQVKFGRLARGNDIGQCRGNFTAKLARGHRAHVDPRPRSPRPDGIHANAVAQQCATAFAPRWVNADERNMQCIA